MRVTLVFPPNRNIPACPYGGLPLLAGCLMEAGHEVEIVDANLDVFEGLISKEVLQRAQGMYEEAWGKLDGKEELTVEEARHMQGLATLGIVPFDHLMHAEEAGRILRTRDEFMDPDKANWAYDVIANVMRVVYSMNPVFYPLQDDYTDHMFGYLKSEFSNLVSQITEEVVIDKVLAGNPDLVAVSIPFNEQCTEAFAFLKALRKRRPDIKTILGGSIINSFHHILCTDERFYEYADYGMPGEADISFPQFCTTLEQGGDLSTVPNLYWRNDAGEIQAPSTRSLPNLNEIAAPDFSSMDLDRYFLPHLVINYQTSRGCYYGKCTFCSFDIKKNFRFRKAELVISDIEKIKEQTGARHLVFWDPLTPPRLMRDVSKWNTTFPEDERIYWGAETKFEKIFCDQEYTDLLYEGGCRFLQFGYESGSQRVLDLIVKGNDLSRVHLMLGAFAKSKIAVSVQWFIGFPKATYEEDIESYRYLDEHRDAVVISSYMGTYAISPDDDIFRSNGDLYDIDLFQDEGGRWDFRYRDGTDHYDRTELDQAFLGRGDAETVTRMGFYIYLTEQPDKARQLSNFETAGPFPMSTDEIEGSRPRFPRTNHLRTFDRDVFTPPTEQGITPDKPGRLKQVDTHAVLVTQSQFIFPLTPEERKLVDLADGSRTVSELTEAMGSDLDDTRQKIFDFIRRGVLVIGHDEIIKDVPAKAAVA